jgi:phosphate transport system permease protein
MKMSRSQSREAALLEHLVEFVLFVCASLSVLTTVGIAGVLIYESIEFFFEVSPLNFLTDLQWTPLFADQHFGILPLLTGTMLVTSIAALVALPTGLLIAVYLSEFAPHWLRRIVKPLLEVLAGIPTVVYGYFALLIVTPLLQRVIPDLAGFNALSPGIVVGLMILPLVTSLSEDAMRAVPGSFRHAAMALGATRLQTAFKVVIPAAGSWISASFILAVSRAVGETMIVTIAAGQQPRLSLNPLQPLETMTAYIVQVSLGDTPAGSLEYQTIFVVGMTLFTTTLCLNAISHRLRIRFRKVYR